MLSLLSNEFSNRDDGGCKAGASPVMPESGWRPDRTAQGSALANTRNLI